MSYAESDASEWMEEENEQQDEDEHSDKENNDSRKTSAMKNEIGRVLTKKVKEVAKEREKEEIGIEREGSHEKAVEEQEIEKIETKRTRTEEKTEKKIQEILVNNWVIVKYALKKGFKYYVGVVQKKVDLRWEVKFVRRKGSMFAWPITEDVDQIMADSIVQILPNPELTKRGLITFDFEFKNIIIS